MCHKCDDEYWRAGRAPKHNNFTFKDINNKSHTMFLLQDPSDCAIISSIFENRAVAQHRRLESYKKRYYYYAEEILELVRKAKRLPEHIQDVDNCRVRLLEKWSIVDIVARSFTEVNPEYKIIGLGLGENEGCIYLGRTLGSREQRIKVPGKKVNEASGAAVKGGPRGGRGEGHRGGHHDGRHDVPHGERFGHHRGGVRGGPLDGHGGHGGHGGHNGGGGRGGPLGGHGGPRPGPRGGLRGQPGHEGGAANWDNKRQAGRPAPSVANTMQTVNAGHWAKSTGPWAFGGVMGVNDNGRAGGRPAGGHGGRGI